MIEPPMSDGGFGETECMKMGETVASCKLLPSNPNEDCLASMFPLETSGDYGGRNR
jgi:hypothetical protein